MPSQVWPYHIKLNGKGFIVADNTYTKREMAPFVSRFAVGQLSGADATLWQQAMQNDFRGGAWEPYWQQQPTQILATMGAFTTGTQPYVGHAVKLNLTAAGTNVRNGSLVIAWNGLPVHLSDESTSETYLRKWDQATGDWSAPLQIQDATSIAAYGNPVPGCVAFCDPVLFFGTDHGYIGLLRPDVWTTPTVHWYNVSGSAGPVHTRKIDSILALTNDLAYVTEVHIPGGPHAHHHIFQVHNWMRLAYDEDNEGSTPTSKPLNKKATYALPDGNQVFSAWYQGNLWFAIQGGVETETGDLSQAMGWLAWADSENVLGMTRWDGAFIWGMEVWAGRLVLLVETTTSVLLIEANGRILWQRPRKPAPTTADTYNGTWYPGLHCLYAPHAWGGLLMGCRGDRQIHHLNQEFGESCIALYDYLGSSITHFRRTVQVAFSQDRCFALIRNQNGASYDLVFSEPITAPLIGEGGWATLPRVHDAYLWLPRFDAGMPNLPKYWHSVVLETRRPIPALAQVNTTVSAVPDNDEEGTAFLLDATVDPLYTGNRYTFTFTDAFNSLHPRSVMLRIQTSGGCINPLAPPGDRRYTTPEVASVSIRYLPQAPAKRVWAFKVWCTEGQKLLDGNTEPRSATEIAADLWAAVDLQKPVILIDRDGTENSVVITDAREDAPLPGQLPQESTITLELAAV